MLLNIFVDFLGFFEHKVQKNSLFFEMEMFSNIVNGFILIILIFF